MFAAIIDLYTIESRHLLAPEQVAQAEHSLNARVDRVAQLYNHACEVIPQMSREDWEKVSSRLFAEYLIFKGAGKGWQIAKKLPAALHENQFLRGVHSSVVSRIATAPEVATAEGVRFKVPKGWEENSSLLMHEAEKMVPKATKIVSEINQSSVAILKNGYYEVNGFKFTEYYYNKLWNNGRGAPSILAQEILDGSKNKIADLRKVGFYRYEYGGWELVYNPSTREVWHICVTKK